MIAEQLIEKIDETIKLFQPPLEIPTEILIANLKELRGQIELGKTLLPKEEDFYFEHLSVNGENSLKCESLKSILNLLCRYLSSEQYYDSSQN
jgi:hypothetical protein